MLEIVWRIQRQTILLVQGRVNVYRGPIQQYHTWKPFSTEVRYRGTGTGTGTGPVGSPDGYLGTIHSFQRGNSIEVAASGPGLLSCHMNSYWYCKAGSWCIITIPTLTLYGRGAYFDCPHRQKEDKYAEALAHVL